MTRTSVLLCCLGIFWAVSFPKPVPAADTTGSSHRGSGQLISTSGEGKLYRYGALHVVELHGNYREMGRQYGVMRKDVLNEVHRQMMNNPTLVSAAKDMAMREKELQAVYAAYPQYDAMMKGIAETSGLGDQAYLVCSYIQLFHVLTADSPAPGGCSFNAVWGPYTSDAKVIAGRNFDLSNVINRYTEIVVYNPDDGSIPVAKVGYVGSVYLTSGFNRAGLFLELNNGDVPYARWQAQQGPANIATSPKNIDTYLELFQLVQHSADTAELDRRFASARTTVGCIINAADTNGAFSYEWIPGKYTKRAPFDNESLVATNDFIDPSWGLSLPPPGSSTDTGQSILRLFNLMMMNYKHKGTITPQRMMQLMSTPTSEGGPFFPTYTSYQMVVVPADLKIWFRVPEHHDWTEVDLSNHFDPACR
ncbi:MAG TPA: C45 family autoproteolytic acyltransferase/hydrolase [Acidobacteriota bacterium]|mgnify:FL=1|nr:C45 family autoproteolytic acyltransferase/hydrolase [Acidobacteriota bacterium]